MTKSFRLAGALAAAFALLLSACSWSPPGRHYIGHALWRDERKAAQLFFSHSADARFQVIGCCAHEVGQIRLTNNGMLELRMQTLSGTQNGARIAPEQPVQLVGKPEHPFHASLGSLATGDSIWFANPLAVSLAPLPDFRSLKRAPGMPEVIYGVSAATFKKRSDPLTQEKVVMTGLVTDPDGSGRRGGIRELITNQRQSDPDPITPVDPELKLEHPSGASFSPNGEQLYVVEETSSEIIWLKFEQSTADFCHHKWTYRGVFARFLRPKAVKPRLYRGIVTLENGAVIGSAPDGLHFFDQRGTEVGLIETPDQVTYLIVSELVSNGQHKRALVAEIGESLAFLELDRAQASESALPEYDCAAPAPPPPAAPACKPVIKYRTRYVCCGTCQPGTAATSH
jgi:hypothetical protein